MNRRVVLLLAGVSMLAAPAQAKEPARLTLPEDYGVISFWGRDRFRYESWDYFRTNTDNQYDFYANQLRLSSKWVHEIFNVNTTWQYTQLSGLPATTSAGAGSGSLYFSNSRQRDAYGQFVKYLNLEIKQTRKLLKPLFGELPWLRGVSELFGRFSYSSGNEMRSGDKRLDAIKSQRIADRMIGGFEWTHFGRSFDGYRIAREDDSSFIQVAGFHPTQGGFEEYAGRSISDVGVIAVEANIKKDKLIPGMEENFFYYGYDDHRVIAATTARFDNMGRTVLAGRESDIEIHSFGGHMVGNYKVGPGMWDILGWGVYQTGTWYDVDHEAFAFAAETGYQFTELPWKPWIRTGYNYGSGDENGADGEHNTFFQMMPTARLYSPSLLCNMQNSEDIFVSLTVKPAEPWTVRTEYHRLCLAEKADRWYVGSGPMHTNVLDDYAARASRGSNLGHLVDIGVTWQVKPDVTIHGYYGHFFGGDVIRNFFAKRQANDMAYVEVTVNF